MVQKEVAKKTRTYGVVGILLAVILVATIYTYGTVPLVSVLPNGNPQGMATFTSYDELGDFLNATGSNWDATYSVNGQTSNPTPDPMPSAVKAEDSVADYSTTNIQVAGVDEADTVKTDGKYLYVIGNNSQVIYILDANPQNARVLAKIWLNNTYISGLYLSDDGNKLVVLGSTYQWFDYWRTSSAGPEVSILPWYGSSTSFVYVYNVQNKAAPVLARNFTMSGNAVNSRMIGNYVYEIVSENAYLIDGKPFLPIIFTAEGPSNVSATSIYYANTTGSYYSYTTVTAININNDAEPTTNMTILMGNAGTIYVSQSNMYITFPVTEYIPLSETTTSATPITKDDNDTITILPMPIRPWWPSWQGTAIYRVQISGSSLTFAANGNVTGNVMSQYSMDEHNGYFRVATTSYEYTNPNSWMGTQQNNLYVLNSNLQVVGKIEDLASGESLHAARFMGNRCYLVTFQQVDPLFVIDLTNPANPTVLGNLTIPGYSDFLQPYDATHLIGVGQDVNASIDADKVHTEGAIYYTAILGLKVSLFDVSDVANPKEISKLVIGERGTTSAATYDPKALLFDAERNLLVLPVDLYKLVNYTYSYPKDLNIVPPSDRVASTWVESVPMLVWQGAYIFDVSVDGGLVIRGNVTQLDNAAALYANPSLVVDSSYQWINYGQFITRSMYIGNTLYTFSDTAVQLNSLTDFSLIAKVALQ